MGVANGRLAVMAMAGLLGFASVGDRASATGYVTGTTLGTLRNDFSGYLGMEIVVGASPLNVVALGRGYVAGNSGTHVLKLVNAMDGTDVPGGSATVTMAAGPAGQFQYVALSNAVTLVAGRTYFVVSQETANGDQWYNNLDTEITTNGAAAQSGAVWGLGPGQWYPTESPGQSYGPVNFQYTNAGYAANSVALGPDYVTGTVPGSVRNNFSGYVGMEIVVGTNRLSVVALGRCHAPGDSGVHVVKLVNAADGTDVPGGSVTLAVAGGTVGQFQHAALSHPVTLAAGGTYYVVSEESAGGDPWYDLNTSVTTTGVATESAGVWGFGPGQWQVTGTPGQAYVPVDFQYTNGMMGTDTNAPGGFGTEYVIGTTLGTLRNDFSGYVGMEIVVGANPLNVVALGRCYAAGNSGTHGLKVVDTLDGTDVPGGSATVTMAGGIGGQFRYAALSNAVTLVAGRSYYVVSDETANGDQWYNNLDTEITTTGAAQPSGAVWGLGPGQWYPTESPGQSYGPVNFQYTNANYAANSVGLGTDYVSGIVPGNLQNNFSGYVGMEIVVGTTPLNVVALGRCHAPGDSGVHVVKLVGADGADVPGGSVTLATAGGTAGQFQHAALSSPVTLAAGGTYYVVSEETAGGDPWYDLNTSVTTTDVATEGAGVWGFGPGQWHVTGTPGQAYVPVDFQYTNAPGLGTNVPGGYVTEYVTGTTLGTLRNDFSGYLGMEIVVGASPLNVVALGRGYVAGNSGTHVLKLVNAMDGTDVPGGSAAVTMAASPAGQFQYVALSNAVTLVAGQTYYLVSQETANGDRWYNNLDTEIATTGAAAQSGAVWGLGPGQWYPTESPGRTYVPVDFQYTNAGHAANSVRLGTDYVTGTTPGSARNNFSGYVGMAIVVGANPLSVVALGRCYGPGDNGVHVVKLVNAADGTDVPGGSVTLAVAGGTVGQFQHAALNSPVTLAAGGTYYVVSEETAGGDLWYDLNTSVTTTSVATESAGVWGLGPGQWHVTGTPGQAYVPVDFQFSNSQSAASAPEVTNGLVAWYPLAGSPYDYSANGYNGVFNGSPMPTNGVDGAPGTAMYFAGNYMSVPDVLVPANTSFSVSLWVQPSQLNDTYQALVDGGAFNVASSGWGLGFNDRNQLFIACGPGYEESPFVLSPGLFYHVVVTAQAGSPYAFTFYVNGEPMPSTSVAPVTSWSQNTGITEVARSVNGSPVYFTGAMADLRIYNRALSPPEVVTLYTNNSSRQVEPPGAVPDPDLIDLKFLDDISASPQYSYVYWPAPLKDSSAVHNPNVLYYSNAGHEDDVWVDVNGVTAAGLHWHGVDGSYADTGDPTHFAFTTNSYTIALWVQPMTAYGTFLSCGLAGVNGWSVNDDVNYNLFFNTYSNGVTSSVGSLPVHNDTFHAILISVANGTNVTMYRDGMRFATGTVTAPAPAGTNTLMLGQQNLGTSFGRTLDGNMWLTQIWSTNLDAMQASYLYLNQMNGSPWPP